MGKPYSLDLRKRVVAARHLDAGVVLTRDMVTIKRVLDAGAQSLLVPYVCSAEEAKAAVAAMRYPPAGVRGVAGTTRASRFGRVKDYAKRAQEEP